MKVALFLTLLFLPVSLPAYSTLTHEAIIDSLWDESIKPLLLLRFPNASEQEIRDARRYMYGGSMAEDMGYYPFGSKFFSDLIHYVRSGDYVESLLHESRTIQEYAFALGTLSHYAADSSGHPLSTNRAVPILYPELRAKYGNIVTYEDKPSAHIKVEFGYDVVQVVRGNYLEDAYHDFIGFEIAKDLLKRAIPKTYALEIDDVFGNMDMAIGTFRFSVRGLIPEMTKVAWQLKKNEILKLYPDMTEKKFLYLMPRNKYEEEWGNKYRKPGFFARILAFVIRVIPKFGPLKVLAFKPPTPEVEKMFLESYAQTVELYRSLLAREKSARLNLSNLDLDTGQPTKFGEYELCDKAYAKLIDKLAKQSFRNISPELQRNILEYYGDIRNKPEPKKHKKDWRKLVRQVETLKSVQLQ